MIMKLPAFDNAACDLYWPKYLYTCLEERKRMTVLGHSYGL